MNAHHWTWHDEGLRIESTLRKLACGVTAICARCGYCARRVSGEGRAAGFEFRRNGQVYGRGKPPKCDAREASGKEGGGRG